MSYHTEVDRWCIKQFGDRDCGYKSVFKDITTVTGKGIHDREERVLYNG